MKKIFTIALCSVYALSMMAQEVDKATVQKQADAAAKAQADLKAVDTGDKAWKFTGVVGLNAAATGLWNWAAGGNNNVNGFVYGKMRLLYHKNKFAWDTNLDMEYGLSWIDQKYDALQKSNDAIKFATKFGWEFHPTWYLTAVGAFQSQFANGRNYTGTEADDPIISKFLAPSYTDISVGIDWKPNDIFSVYLSPVAGRLTSVYLSKGYIQKYDDPFLYPDGIERALKESYSVWRYDIEEGTDRVIKNYDRNLRSELGLSFKGSINYTYKDLKIITTLGLYTPYAWDKTKIYVDENGVMYADMNRGKDFTGMTFVGYRDNNRRFGNFDVDWDVAISYQFLKCLQVTLSTSLKYYNGVKIDKVYNRGTEDEYTEAAERVQFKGILGIGVGYSF